MRLELKQEQALRSAAKDELQRLEARKDEHLSELASELGSVQAVNKRLESELERARGELLGGETAITNLKRELMEKDNAIATLRTDLLNKDEEIKEKEKTISELENLIVSAAKNDDVGDTPANPISPHNTQDLKTLIKGWKRQAKNTRDWTKANQLISELENLL